MHLYLRKTCVRQSNGALSRGRQVKGYNMNSTDILMLNFVDSITGPITGPIIRHTSLSHDKTLLTVLSYWNSPVQVLSSKDINSTRELLMGLNDSQFFHLKNTLTIRSKLAKISNTQDVL